MTTPRIAVAAVTPLAYHAPPCRTCTGPNDDGEGWDGECGNCADRTEAASPCVTCGKPRGIDGFDDECGPCAYGPETN